MKVTQCKGEGQGQCKRCMDNGKWNKAWMCFLYKIDGLEGCYCRECVEKLQEEANRIITVLEKCCAKNVPYLELNLHKNKKLLAEIDNISDIEVAKLVIKYMLKKIYRLYFFYF